MAARMSRGIQELGGGGGASPRKGRSLGIFILTITTKNLGGGGLSPPLHGIPYVYVGILCAGISLYCEYV